MKKKTQKLIEEYHKTVEIGVEGTLTSQGDLSPILIYTKESTISKTSLTDVCQELLTGLTTTASPN